MRVRELIAQARGRLRTTNHFHSQARLDGVDLSGIIVAANL
jgi:hypothetical protein